jgi:hypothetical protein
MHWERTMGAGRAQWLRKTILRALEEAYDENCRRFAPEDLGDNNITFGVAVSQNLRFLLERALEGATGIAISRPQNSFVVVVDGIYRLHFYKAPPGIFDVRSLRFDASKTQLALVQENADQLAFRFDATDDGSSDGEPGHIVVVHFGDPLEGLHRADVGAPVASSTAGLEWEWVECLSDPTLEIGDPSVPPEEVSAADDEVEDFDLRLREDGEEEGEGMSEGDPSG